MLRLGIEYDFLPRESEILHLKFWEAAFEQLKKTGVLYFENEGKNKGCWVMTRPGRFHENSVQNENGRRTRTKTPRSSSAPTAPSPTSAKTSPTTFGSSACSAATSATSRSSATRRSIECWISAEHGEEPHPHFGGATAIYNVIDSRQADPQANVIQALRGMGHTGRGRPLHAFQLRDGRAHAALRGGTRL